MPPRVRRNRPIVVLGQLRVTLQTHLFVLDRFDLLMLEQPLGDELRLLLHVAQRDEGRQDARVARSAELLGELAPVACDGEVGQLQHLGR